MTTSMLHFTNGSVAADLLRAAGMRGDIVPWDDVLHEGPVPQGLGPAALRARRAAFLASWGGATTDAIARSLASRDAFVERASGYSEVVLWFEHDLYDQLQLIQILDVLPYQLTVPISMPTVPGYLGTLGVDAIPPLFATRQPLTSSARSAAIDAWTAFRSPDPRTIVDVMPRVEALPHLGRALVRHLEQFPSAANGLSRTEQQAMAAIAGGARVMRETWVQSHHRAEDAVFMGDAGFLHHLSGLVASARPLLVVEGAGPLTLDAPVSLTPDGVRVHAGEADRVALCGIHRWLGGVELTGYGPVWRWDGRGIIYR